MAWINLSTVPNDMWICGGCKGGNLIALTDGKCPVCGHERDACCTGPGKPYPKTTGLFPGHPEYQHLYVRPAILYYPAPIDASDCTSSSFTADYIHRVIDSYSNQPATPNDFDDVWVCSECGAENCDWVDVCPVCNRGTKSAVTNLGASPAHGTYGGAGSPVSGVLVSQTCGASNSDITPDFCSACESTC